MMKTVILCGGLGTRLGEETHVKPKPMVEVGGRPILWHIMKTYERAGLTDFVLALGYKGDYIKQFFLNYHPLTSDLTVHLKSGAVEYSNTTAEDWRILMSETGKDSLTGGRLKRLERTLKSGGTFCLTYGDGVSDISISALLEFHRKHGKIATITAVRPSARFGNLVLEKERVVDFKEKPQTGEGWINGGFFVFEPTIFDYLKDDRTVLEESPLEELARQGELMAFQHSGFWYCMDTLRDKNMLESMWAAGKAPWKVW